MMYLKADTVEHSL